MTILVTGARAPVALDIARSFRAAGHDVHLADSVAAYAACWSRSGFPVHRLPPPRHQFGAFREELSALVDRLGATLVVPTCEEVFYVVAAADGAYPVFAPPLATLRALHSKSAFVGLARAAGVRVPDTQLLTDPAQLAGLDLGRLVLKPEFSRFAAATLIRPRDVRRVKPSPDHRWVAQEYVAGEEVCLWSAVVSGVVTTAVVYRPTLRHGRSAAYAFEAIDCPAAVEVARRIAAATGMTGHLSFDLILTANGEAVPIECNPRAVSGVHLYDGETLARAIIGEPQPAPPLGTRRHLSPAMALLGAPTSLVTGRIAQFARTWREGTDAIGRPGDRWPAIGAIVDAARFAALGLTRHRSPTRQTTDDIEWNGEPIG
ncbi:hypothetical protein M0208_05550 [Sphingomonas sp. SUN019]|uniref:hypothetical protein n=1 Tax=Sphingomonas sp. SUN019 TaxID=2937788 RepID=UPI002164BC5C|nr:hypothetical protein [Sphingomonas sp. SUN019]UVO50009.1 hypothetical protein M0208_05550 [Sphingomonas sp. SUN019]